MGCRAQIFWFCVGGWGCTVCRHLPRCPCGQAGVISAGRGAGNRGGR